MKNNISVTGSRGARADEARAALAGGALSGVAGLMVFLVIHQLWIMPIWFILPLGLVIAALGGLAVGWVYAEVASRLPPRPWRILIVIASIVVILLPGTVLAELRSPMFALSPSGPIFQMSIGQAVFIFVTELLLTATVTGGLLGWWLGRTKRAAAALALAGFIFALGPGHNIPFIGGTAGVAKEFAIMGLVIVASSMVLVQAYTYFTISGVLTNE